MKKALCLLVTSSWLSLLSFSNCFAATHCSASQVISDIQLFFYDNPLGTYTIFLQPTLVAIKSGDAGSNAPYFKKQWYGACPGNLDGAKGSCIEYTVYPDNQNFYPAGIMEKIKEFTHDQSNRGVVRILTDAHGSEYAYTTDHERTFCGPYLLK